MTATIQHSMLGTVVSLALGLAAGGAGGADLFVAGTLGEVYFADPDVGEFELFGGICLAPIQSLAIDDASVFAGDLNGGILRLDIESGDFMEVYFVTGDATDLVVHDGDLLVSTSFGEIVRVETVGGAHIRTLASPITVQAMAIDGDDLYIAGTIGTIYKGNAITGDFQFFGGTCLAPVQALAIGQTSLYAGDETGAILRFDLATGDITDPVFFVGNGVTAIVMDGPDLLVSTFAGTIWRLDPGDGAVIDTMTSPIVVSAMELVPAAADLDGDGTVGIVDFLALLAVWGPCPGPPAGCPADLDGDGAVGVVDMLMLLADWG